MTKTEPRSLALAAIDRRFASLRLISSADLRRLRVSIEREGIRHAVLVSTAVDPERSVLLDGFKRVRVAEELELETLWAHGVALDAAQSKAAMLHANQAQRGLSDIEEAWIVRALVRDHGMTQVAVGELLGRDKSWVCRRLKLAEALEATLQDDLHLGLLSASAARELARLPRGNQISVARVIRIHNLSSRQAERLVDAYLEAEDEKAQRQILCSVDRVLAKRVMWSPVERHYSELSSYGNDLLCGIDGVVESMQHLLKLLDDPRVHYLSSTEATIPDYGLEILTDGAACISEKLSQIRSSNTEKEDER